MTIKLVHSQLSHFHAIERATHCSVCIDLILEALHDSQGQDGGLSQSLEVDAKVCKYMYLIHLTEVK